jgi:hypothetical protein
MLSAWQSAWLHFGTYSTHLDGLFQCTKEAIVADIQHGVRIFDTQRPTCIMTDWSKQGIGFWLLQKHCNCTEMQPLCCKSGWHTTLVGSRFTHQAESRYAPIEGEALAVAYALDTARYFVLGCTTLIIATDHKPLLKIFGDRSLEDLPNGRLRNLKERTLRYKFDMIHIPGVRNKEADCISRQPSGTATKMTLPDDEATAAATDDPSPTTPTVPRFLLHASLHQTGHSSKTRPSSQPYTIIAELTLLLPGIMSAGPLPVTTILPYLSPPWNLVTPANSHHPCSSSRDSYLTCIPPTASYSTKTVW